MKLSNGLSTGEELGVRIGTPVGRSMPTNEFVKCQSVALWSRIVLTKIGIDIDGQARQCWSNNFCCLACARKPTRHQHINGQFLGLCKPIAKSRCLEFAQLRQTRTRSRTTKNSIYCDNRFAVPHQHDAGFTHTNFSTKPSSWRRLRHSYTPSVKLPYSPTTESPVFQ